MIFWRSASVFIGVIVAGAMLLTNHAFLPAARAGTVVSSSIWQWPDDAPNVLLVCWENPDPDPQQAADQMLVRQAVEESWQAHSQLRFQGWERCAPDSRGIRIRIADEGPHTKALGRFLDGLRDGMVLNFTFEHTGASTCRKDEEIRRRCIYSIAVHQFGHALGFAHEHSRPDTPPECRKAVPGTPYVKSLMPGDRLLTSYDPDSVMNYCSPVWNNDGRLTEADRISVAILYGEPPEAAGRVIGWKSRVDTPAEIGQQVADLYVSLYNLAKLPVRRVINTYGARIDVEAMFRGEKQFFGSEFPPKLYALACDINPGKCQRHRELASTEALNDLVTTHAGGYLPSSGVWRDLDPGDVLFLPDVTFHRSFDVQEVLKIPGQDIESIIARLGGCEVIDETCLAFVDRLNRGIEFKRVEFRGRIMAPALALTAVIDIDCPPKRCAGGFDPETARVVADKLGTAPPPISVEPKDPNPVSIDPKDPDPPPVRGISGSKIVASPMRSLQRLLPHLWGDIEFVVSATIDKETLYDSQRSMFEFINFPWLKEEYPSQYKRGVGIGVLEVNLAAKHCDLPPDEDKFQVWSVREPAITPEAPAPLDIRRELPEVSDCSGNNPSQKNGSPADHGFHVLGIIGAQVNGKGVAGLNPHAKIYAMEYKDTLLKGKEYQNAFAAELESLIFREDVRVVNMSFRYDPKLNLLTDDDSGLQPTTDRLQDVIEKSPHVLFVAAAGHVNQGVGYNLTRFCNIYPACLELPNLITVVALSGDARNPSVASWANFGSQFSIGALGEDILSTGSSNDFVLLKGSSMAAPQVTAVASLLFAHPAGRGAQPQQVKNRLLACATPAAQLDGRMWSGVMDAECSLEKPELGRLVLRNPQEVLHGNIVGGMTGDEPLRRPVFYDPEADEELSPSWSKIYAMRQDPTGFGRLILFTYEHPERRATSELVRRPRLVLAPDMDQALLFRPEVGADKGIPLDRVVDFVAAMD
jgi:subtilisin family serine protease